MKRSDLRKAAKLYEDFRERPAKRARRIDVDIPDTVTVIGHVRALEYDTTIGRSAKKFRHDFNTGSAPLLCADPVSGQIFIFEGRYRITERGIVDLDSRGRELDD